MQSNLKLIISDAVQFFIRHLRQIAVLCLPWLLATSSVETILTAGQQESDPSANLFLLAVAFKLLVYPIYTAALILLMSKRARQEAPTNRELFQEAMKLWQPLFMLVMIIVGLAAIGSILMIMLESLFQFFLAMKGFGLLLAALLLFWGMARLAFAKFILVLNRVRPSEAIIRSFQDTRPYFLQIAMLLALFVVPLLGLNLLAGIALSKTAAPAFIRALIGTGIEFLLLFVEVVLFRLYMSAIQENPSS